MIDRSRLVPLRRVRRGIACTLVLLTAPLLAQHPPPRRDPPPAEAGQYNFLLGQWELTVEVPPSGLAARLHGVPKLVGTWKAWRALAGWGISDELAITDEAGNPVALSHSIRFYDPRTRRWRLSTLDVYRGTFSAPTGQWREGAMHHTARGPDGRQLTRSKIYDIRPGSFRMRVDRSEDGGRSWIEGTLRLEARRVATTARR